MTTAHNAKTWLITGASSGLGLALAEAALRAGERVVGTARRTDRLAILESEFESHFLAVQHDVRKTRSAPAIVQQALDAFGQVDVLVNNAGAGQVGAADEVTARELQTCLTSTFTVRGPTFVLYCHTCVANARERSSR